MEGRQPETDGEISVRNINGKTVLSPVAALTRKNGDQMRSLLESLMKKGVSEIILDLSKVPYFDSMALEILVDSHQALQSTGGALLLSSVNEVCRDILICVRLIHQFPIMDQTYHRQ